MRSITDLCAMDHGGDRAAIADWTANKTPENLARWIGDRRSIFLVAREGVRLAGVAAGAKAGAVHLLYVDPDFRFQGVSGRLLAAQEAEMNVAGATVGRLRTTMTARKFYLARGWSVDDAAPDGDMLVKRFGPRPGKRP